ncbi:MAG: FtsK/SpoIIIE domain-containing protein [Clostridium sp.]|uniref:FtsK/SpoIIIE domain-containing protein n=1 Tax=Clostridium sp. TaxID=1506 RepID=UPI003EE5338C
MITEMYVGSVALAWLHSLTFTKRKNMQIEREINYIFDKVVDFGAREDDQKRFTLNFYTLTEYGFQLFVKCDGGDLNIFKNYIKRLEYEYEGTIIATNLTDGIRVKVWLDGMPISSEDKLSIEFDKAYDSVRNEYGDTFSIARSKEIKSPSDEVVGELLEVNIPPGLNIDLLKKYANNLNFLGKSIAKIKENKAYIEIINKTTNIEYKPIKVKGYELYVGTKSNYNPLILNYRDNANAFICGKPTSGKTRIMIQGVLNVIGCNKDVELYIAASDKRDLEIFKNTANCTECENKLEDILKMLQRLNKEVKRRNELMPVSEMIFDIYAYNERKKDKLSIIHFLSDEISDLMVSDENDSNYNLKKAITDILIEIGRKGRSVGVYLTLATQRAGSSCIHPDLKALLGNKIILSQNNEQSIKLAVGHEDLNKIRMVSSLDTKKREFMYDSDEIGLGMACMLDDNVIQKYIKHLLVRDGNVVKINIKKKQRSSGRFGKLKAQ